LRSTLRAATSRASAEISVASTVSDARSVASVIAIAPLPVHKSSANAGSLGGCSLDDRGKTSSARSTTSSVSGRGTSTAGLTSNVRR